jgi:parallel beta-helix repeat protein
MIFVKSGTYNEQVNVNKSVTISAFGDGPVTIDGRCKSNYGVVIQANNVTLRGMNVVNTGEASVYIGDVDGPTVDRMTLKDWNCANTAGQYRAGVACWYCSGLTVTDSRIETIRKNGNGIWLKSTSANPSTGGHTIARNTIIGGFDGIGSETEGDVWGGFVRDSIIEGNTIHNCDDDGIQMEGRNQNIRVRNNTITQCAIGIAFAPNLVGPLYIEGNTMTNLVPKFYNVQACFKIGQGGSGTTYITGNTCSTAGDGFKQTNSGLSPMVARNNCIQVSRYVIEFFETPGSSTSFDYDTMWTSDSSRFVKWGSSNYSSLTSFRSGANQEQNGQQSTNC